MSKILTETDSFRYISVLKLKTSRKKVGLGTSQKLPRRVMNVQKLPCRGGRLFGAADSVLTLFGTETIQRRDDSALADSAQAVSVTGRFGAGRFGTVRFGAGTFRRNFIFLLQ